MCGYASSSGLYRAKARIEYDRSTLSGCRHYLRLQVWRFFFTMLFNIDQIFMPTGKPPRMNQVPHYIGSSVYKERCIDVEAW